MKRKFGQLMAAGVFVLAAAIPSPSPAEPRGGTTGGPSLVGPLRMTDLRGAGRMQGIGGPGVGPTLQGPETKGMKGVSPVENHGMALMGDKIFGGKVGPWQCEARLMNMKTHIEKVKASGMKMEGVGTKSHHVAVYLTDPGTKKPVAVTKGKGTVTVTGPDKNSEKSDFMVTEGHFGADVNLSKPGEYAFRTEIQSGDKKGSASFSYTVK